MKFNEYFDKIQNVTIADMLLLNFANRTKCPKSDQRQVVVSGQTMPNISDQLNASTLVELLQQAAVEHLTTFRELEAQEKCSHVPDVIVVTTDFEAIHAYKCGEYQRCLQLSTHTVRRLIDVASDGSGVSLLPQFPQLMDDDIASLVGLTFILTDISPSRPYVYDVVYQLYLSLYLMAQCQIKLHHSVTSLAQTLHYVKVARRHVVTLLFSVMHDHGEVMYQRIPTSTNFDLKLLKLTERKIQMYISRE